MTSEAKAAPSVEPAVRAVERADNGLLDGFREALTNLFTGGSSSGRRFDEAMQPLTKAGIDVKRSSSWLGPHFSGADLEVLADIYSTPRGQLELQEIARQMDRAREKTGLTEGQVYDARVYIKPLQNDKSYLATNITRINPDEQTITAEISWSKSFLSSYRKDTADGVYNGSAPSDPINVRSNEATEIAFALKTYGDLVGEEGTTARHAFAAAQALTKLPTLQLSTFGIDRLRDHAIDYISGAAPKATIPVDPAERETFLGEFISTEIEAAGTAAEMNRIVDIASADYSDNLRFPIIDDQNTADPSDDNLFFDQAEPNIGLADLGTADGEGLVSVPASDGVVMIPTDALERIDEFVDRRLEESLPGTPIGVDFQTNPATGYMEPVFKVRDRR